MIDRQFLTDAADLLESLVGKVGDLRRTLRDGTKLKSALLARNLKLATQQDVQELKALLQSACGQLDELEKRVRTLENQFGVTVKPKNSPKSVSGKQKVKKLLKTGKRARRSVRATP